MWFTNFRLSLAVSVYDCQSLQVPALAFKLPGGVSKFFVMGPCHGARVEVRGQLSGAADSCCSLYVGFRTQIQVVWHGLVPTEPARWPWRISNLIL